MNKYFFYFFSGVKEDFSAGKKYSTQARLILLILGSRDSKLILKKELFYKYEFSQTPESINYIIYNS